MSADDAMHDPILIPARLAVGEAADHQARLLKLVAEGGPRTIDFTEAEGCAFPSAVSLQLCLAAAAELRAQGALSHYGPTAERLLSAQNLL